jgi:hypothetical protein
MRADEGDIPAATQGCRLTRMAARRHCHGSPLNISPLIHWLLPCWRQQRAWAAASHLSL